MIQLNPRYEATFKVKHIIHHPSNIIHLTDECRGGFHQGGTGCRVALGGVAVKPAINMNKSK